VLTATMPPSVHLVVMLWALHWVSGALPVLPGERQRQPAHIRQCVSAACQGSPPPGKKKPHRMLWTRGLELDPEGGEGILEHLPRGDLQVMVDRVLL
jgi:hypothetical protein